jgi:peptide/nickel transport system permease protein
MQYVINKIIQTFLALFGVASLVFLLFTVLPGDPAQMMLDQNEDSKLLKVIKEKFGFNLPLSKQYFYYLNDLSPISYHSKNPMVFAHYDKSIYGGWKIFNDEDYVLVMKLPYLRTSYQKKRKSYF